jgi:hypothetical protein
LKKIQNQKTATGSGYFKKTSQNCRVSRKPGKEGICKMGINRIKTRSQRITSSGYLKKNQNQRTVAAFGYFKKTSQNCRVSQKPGKEEPCRFLGNYFTFTI